MINRTFGLAVCFTVAVGLAGCASNPPPSAPPPAPVAAPAPTPPPPPAVPPGLSAAQQKVAKLQIALNANGAQLQVDGRWGKNTSDALKAYQSAHQLKPTGRPDAATVKALGL